MLYFQRWIPACAGMTGDMLRIDIGVARIPACAGVTLDGRRHVSKRRPSPERRLLSGDDIKGER